MRHRAELVALATLRDCRIKASQETIQKALVGTWRAEHVFTLMQSRGLYRVYQQQIVECDREIETALRADAGCLIDSFRS